MSKTLPTVNNHLHRSAAKMSSISETTRTLRYELWSREIYIEEPITCPEILLKNTQTQEENISSIQETPNSQFRLVLSVTPCVPRISTLESVNDNTSPLLFSPTSSLTFVPPPKDQPPPSPTSSTSSLTSFHTCNTSSQHNKALSPELFSPTPTSQNKWPSPPPLPQRSPRIRRHNLRNYASLASTNMSQEKRNSVGAPPLDSLTSILMSLVRKHTRPSPA